MAGGLTNQSRHHVNLRNACVGIDGQRYPQAADQAKETSNQIANLKEYNLISAILRRGIT